MSTNKIFQINYVKNKKKGIIRGLHYQTKPFTEEKAITCVKGKILSVMVQMDKKKNNYLKVYKFILSAKNKNLLIVPKYYANGYQVLDNNSEVVYFSNNQYKNNYEKVVNPNDPTLNIKWPIKKNIKSKKDKNAKFIV